jgi:hypothetical protein
MDSETFLDNLDINNLSNLAPELLEYDDEWWENTSVK